MATNTRGVKQSRWKLSQLQVRPTNSFSLFLQRFISRTCTLFICYLSHLDCLPSVYPSFLSLFNSPWSLHRRTHPYCGHDVLSSPFRDCLGIHNHLCLRLPIQDGGFAKALFRRGYTCINACNRHLYGLAGQRRRSTYVIEGIRA